MKYDGLELKEVEGFETEKVEKKIRKKRKVGIVDVVIVQLILGVAISAVVLTARMITVANAAGAIGQFFSTVGGFFAGLIH